MTYDEILIAALKDKQKCNDRRKKGRKKLMWEEEKKRSRN